MELTSFETRQQNLGHLMSAGSLAILPGAEFITKSNDTEFPFRQDSNFKYLVGSYEPHAIFALKKELDGTIRTILFLRDKDEFAEMWAGIRLGVEKAVDLLPIQEAYPIESFEMNLVELMKNTHRLYYDLHHPSLHQKVLEGMKTLERFRKQSIHRPQSITHISPLVGRLRLQKDSNEIMAMRQAAKLTTLGFKAAMSMANETKTEKDVERLLSHIFTLENGEGHAYDPIVAGGTNALVLHYIENDAPLKKEDWLLIDAGSQVNLYASDVTRTFPISGKFSKPQADLYDIVLEAQKAGFSKAAIGHSLTEVHQETSKVLIQALIDEKILEGSVDGILESGAHRKYYPHGTGHWLGLDVHDNSPYKNDDLSDIRFEEGMCFTVEPGLYFKENDPQVPAHWRGLGIRTEDDILITDKGFENLTRSIPKERKEIEEACQRPFEDFIKEIF
ncbi:MAG: Xaa-Pro aminopeptidase [Halobacteriovoraceae bacterium]|nr:Xaa-Pro aminopeptidase [Halobacteriovoraceae bacterium]|tara:strand:+ start:27048 stop:28388 length:1341 start_codon:yes stop_codon:yes gene_type:complete